MTELEIRRDVIERFAGEDATDLPAISPMELDEASTIYSNGKMVGQVAQLMQGWAAACYRKKYGDEGIKRFAAENDEPRSTVQHHAHVYENLMEISDSRRSAIYASLRTHRRGTLSYSHLDEAASIDNSEDRAFLLEAAAKNQWKVHEFRARLKDWKDADTELERQRALEVQQEIDEPKEPEVVVEEQEVEEAEVIEITLPNGEVVDLDRAIEAINEYADEQVKTTVEEKEEDWHKTYADLLARYDVEPNRTMKDLFDNLDEEKVARLQETLNSKINNRRDRATNIVLEFSKLGSRIRDFRSEEFAQHAVGMEEEDIYFNHLTLLSEWLTETLQTWDSLRSGNLAEVSSLRRKGERS